MHQEVLWYEPCPSQFYPLKLKIVILGYRIFFIENLSPTQLPIFVFQYLNANFSNKTKSIFLCNSLFLVPFTEITWIAQLQWLQTLLSPGKKFKSGTTKHAFAIEYPEPLVHFALCSGTYSDPVVKNCF